MPKRVIDGFEIWVYTRNERGHPAARACVGQQWWTRRAAWSS